MGEFSSANSSALTRCVEAYAAVHISSSHVQDSNVILANSQEFRSAKHASSTADNMNTRYVGLIVVPGEHIKRIELEEFQRHGII